MDLLIWTFSIKILARISVHEIRAYAKAGGIAQEALSALRTVLANNSIGFILKR
jgi:hypothetical protein